MIFAKLNNLSSNEKIGLAVSLICVFVLLVDRLVVKSIVDLSNQLDSEIENASKILMYNKRILLEKDYVTEKYESIKDIVETSSTSAQITDEIKTEIDDLLRQVGVNYQSMDDRDPLKSDYFEEYFVEIGGIETDMQRMLELLYELYKLRNTSGMLRVSRIILNPGEKSRTVKGSMQVTKIMMPTG